MNEKYSVTSNEVKLFKHLENLQDIQDGRARPVMFHISPTNVCNMACTHCCFADRDKQTFIDSKKLITFLNEIDVLGIQAIEWTGGGEPTLHPDIGDITKYAAECLHMAIGMNTNAVRINPKLDYSLFSWIRISLNILDTDMDKVKFNKNVEHITSKTKATACYIAGNDVTKEKLQEVVDFANKHNLITRVAPDCIQSKDKIKALIDKIAGLLEELGEKDNPRIFLSDFNIFLGQREDNCCMMHMLKPFLFSDGNIYACPSLELAEENGKNMSEEFRICKMEDVFDYYMTKFEIKHFKCSYCKYTNQNNILNTLMKEVDDVEFC